MSEAALVAFTVVWETAPGWASYKHGSRRVYAENHRDAWIRGKKAVAGDWGIPESKVQILYITQATAVAAAAAVQA